MMKQVLSLILIAAMLLAGTSAIAAEDVNTGLTILLDGKPLPQCDSAYIDENGRTMVNCRALQDVFYFTELFITPMPIAKDDSIEICIYYGDGFFKGLILIIDDRRIYHSMGAYLGSPSVGEVAAEMDTVPVGNEEGIFVPIRYVMEYFGYAVDWDGATQTVLITSPQSSFEFDLLSKMPQDENYMISPVSLKLALAMAANGAGGETKQEILDVLGISDLEQYNSDVLTFINSCDNNEKVELNVANSIWYNTDYYSGQRLEGEAGHFSEYFTLLINSFYKGTAEDITNVGGAKRVNEWISEQTNDKIKDIITDDQVRDSLTFLVNAIYFNGDWQNAFKADSTRDSLFTDRNGVETTTAFMNDTGNYSYTETDSLRMLAKPYKDTDIQMYFILPEEYTTLTQAMFDEALANLSSEYIHFSLPKFKTEYLHSNLKEIMQDFGIETAFKYPDADFWAMFDDIRPDMPVRINNILQKTFIEVDEKGTEAAAATVIDMAPTSAIMPDPIEFICDQPFTYIIRDDSTGTILFMGEYAFVE